MEDLEKDFNLEDISETTQKGGVNPWYEVLQKFDQGKEILLHLAKNYSGERIYIPNFDKLMRPVRKRNYQKKEYSTRA